MTKKKPLLRIGKTVLQTVSQEEETVCCPRKGPWGGEISVLVCDQLHEANQEACERVNCKNAETHRLSIRVLKVLRKNRQTSHKEAVRQVLAGEDLRAPLADFEEDLGEDLEDLEDLEELEGLEE